MRSLFLILLSMLAAFAAEPPRPSAALAAFNREEIKRRRFTPTVEANLTLTSDGGKIQRFPPVVRRVESVENGVCTVYAAFQDGQPVYGANFRARIACVDLQSEISDVSVAEILSHPDLRANPYPDREGRWILAKPARFSAVCLDSSEIRVALDPKSLHPLQVKFVAGVGCLPFDDRSAFRSGSVSLVSYAEVDGVFQTVHIVEDFAPHFRSSDRVPRLTFYFRSFEVQGRPFAPTLRLEKAFSAFSRDVEPVIGPKPRENKPEVESTFLPSTPDGSHTPGPAHQ